MLTNTWRRALVAAAGLTATIAPIVAATPASANPNPDDSGTPGILIKAGPVGCGQNWVAFEDTGVSALVSASCENGYLWLGGQVCDTKEDGLSGWIDVAWPDGSRASAFDTVANNGCTGLPTDWKHKGSPVSVNVRRG